MSKFYVFYNPDDTIRCMGTPEELVAAGKFKTVNAVQTAASYIKKGIRKGSVEIEPIPVAERTCRWCGVKTYNKTICGTCATKIRIIRGSGIWKRVSV